jgi:hypothetical protein
MEADISGIWRDAGRQTRAVMIGKLRSMREITEKFEKMREISL